MMFFSENWKHLKNSIYVLWISHPVHLYVCVRAICIRAFALTRSLAPEIIFAINKKSAMSKEKHVFFLLVCGARADEKKIWYILDILFAPSCSLQGSCIHIYILNVHITYTRMVQTLRSKRYCAYVANYVDFSMWMLVNHYCVCAHTAL